MCGLCGVVRLDAPPESELVRRMTEMLAHRGPDGSGFYDEPGVSLGHRRLAIIDLSDAGLQPFVSDDSSLRLLHNGEIYNYRELRRELEGHGFRFRTATDTEVLLAAYRHWGERCVERLNGMWAFAIWDTRERRLFCSRDRFGVKPFYYRHDGDRFAFASEPKALAIGESTPNQAIVRDFLEQGWLEHNDETFFAGVRKLPPAHSLVFDARGLRIYRHWSLEQRELDGDPVSAFRELFVDSVRLRLRSDVPVGTALSGGLDSSAIACAVDLLLRTEADNARPVGERQRTFTVYFEDGGFDERPYAQAVTERTRAAAHWISFSARELVERLPSVVAAQGEPFASTSIAAQWHVMREARDAGITVMLDGQGGDEVLAGYPAYFAYHLGDLLRAGRLARVASELAAQRRTQHTGAAQLAAALARPFLSERLKRRARARVRHGGALVHADLRAAPGGDDGVEQVHESHLRRQLRLIMTRRGLPELLRYEDRNSMAHSIEARVPFLDYRLVELGFSLPPEQLLGGGLTKRVLRSALRDLLPPVVRDRPDKLGFVTPEARFLREDLGELAGDVFASRAFRERGLVDAAAARGRLDAHRRGDVSAGFELWRALSVELWALEFLDGSLS